MDPLLALIFGLLIIIVGMVSLLVMRTCFSKFFRQIKESHATAEINGPLDNCGVVAELARNVKTVYSLVGGGRYLSREKTVLLSYPPESKSLWALWEAAHEAGHAANPHPLADLLASTPLRRTFSLAAPVAMSYFLGWQVAHKVASLVLLAVLMGLPLITLAAITHDEVRRCLFSRRWMRSYLEKQGCEIYQGIVAKMMYTEVAFEILDGLALFLFFEGAVILFFSLGRAST
ncbi:MAG: hypothetical protein RJR37_00895 [Peptococcaceae bacterium MAG4]|nr:hypothetical protein [Peptococcaceae bacterium MAG4]